MIPGIIAGAAIGGGGGGGGDPYWADVVALLNMDGADGSTTFTDSTGLRTWTAAGNAQIDDSLGYNTALFDGAGDRVTTPYVQADFDWWTTDYTIEAWINPTTMADWSYLDGAQRPAMIGCANPTSTTNYWSFGPRNDGALVFYYFNGSAQQVVSGATVSINNLRHIAMSKNSSGIRLAINGAVTSATAVSGTPQSSTAGGVVLTLGQINNRSINGRVQAVRITKGVARYTSNFTPPAAPWPTS